MSRNLSPVARNAIYAQETGEVFIILLTLNHPDLTGPIRVSSEGVDTVSRGETYEAVPYDVALPDESPDRPPRARLRFDNVDQKVGIAIREITDAPYLTLEVVTDTDRDNPEISYEDFKLSNVTTTRPFIEGDLTFEEFTNERFGMMFTPSLFPGLF